MTLTDPIHNGEKLNKSRQIVRNIATGVVHTFKTLKEALDFIQENKAEIQDIKKDVKEIAQDVKATTGKIKKIVNKAKSTFKK
jgi:prefoldin subunit 5